MASTISAGTSAGTAIAITGDTTGNLAFQTSAGTYTQTMPNATGTIVTTGSPASGNVIQVVNATYATATTTSGTTLVNTGLTASITPKFSTSKILVLVTQQECQNSLAGTGMKLALLRSGSVVHSFAFYAGYVSLGLNACYSTNYLDSPATTSSVTYSTQFALSSANGSCTVQNDSAVSTITLMEIAQ
jgi:hypothetical protein